MSKDDTNRPKRQAVLIVVHADGYLEGFAPKNLDIAFARVPAATSAFGQAVADDCFEMMLPLRYRELWRRDLLRANGTAHPLSAQSVLDALAAKDAIAALTPLMPPKPSRKGAA